MSSSKTGLIKPIFDLIWLASYPKSGNTWFRIFLTNYMRDSDTPASINQLEDSSMSSSRVHFDQAFGILSSELTPDEIDMRRPELYAYWVANEQLRFHKVHDAYTYLPDGQPLLGSPKGQAAIYFVRNPFDVAISYAHHNGHQNFDRQIQFMCDPDAIMAKNTVGLQRQLRQKLGRWGDHILSWRQAPIPVHMMKYEEMLSDTYGTFFKALEFLGITPEPEQLKKAILFSSFEEVKKQEAAEGFREKPHLAKAFFREGGKSKKKQLSASQKQVLLDTFPDLLNELGYTFV